MKKKIIISIFLVFIVAQHGFAQQAQNQGVISPEAPPEDTAVLPIIPNDPATENVGAKRVADEVLKTILIDDFEVPQGWIPSIPLDFGVSRILYRDGSPQAIADNNNKMVLGVKTLFFKRNYGWMSIDRPYPLTIRNVVKNFSLWIAGRNRRHEFFIKVRDILGNRMRIPVGPMEWQGWKKVIVPVKDPVVQFDHKLSRKGIDFLGFHLKFQAEDIVVTEPYYIYVDYLTATIDFADAIESDDISDDW